MKSINYAFKIMAAMIILSASILFSSCREENKDVSEHTEETQTFTCPMHPQVVSHHPSTCPVCGMDLVLFDKNNQDEFLTLGPEQILLANIQTLALGESGLDAVRILNGRIVDNETAKKYISSRNNGRIEEMYIKEEGISVRKGQALLKIYSEELAALQQELKIAFAQFKAFPDNAQFKNIYEAAIHKLKLYGITDNQIQATIDNNQSDPYVIIFAPESGIVTSLNATEGNYVAAGDEIMRIEDFSDLWVEIEVYPNELEMIKKGMEVKAVFAATGNKEFTLKIDFTAPELIPASQLTKIRASVKNPEGLLQPGSQATIFIRSDASEGSLVVPQNAIINEGSGSHVWVEFEEGKFKPLPVTIGVTGRNTSEIISGLSAGDKLVVSGAYLLYSEYILKRGKHPIKN